MKAPEYFKNSTIYLLPILFFFLFACGSSKQASEEEMNQLRTLVESRDFEIQHSWADPVRGSSIDLIGNPNYLRVRGDSVDVALPFFGERYSGGGYNREGGIRFEGPARGYSVFEKSNSVDVRFEARRDSESYEFLITIFPNGNVTTSVNSSQRSSISYRGEVMPEKKE
jgi:hypothetical protein